MKNMIDNSRKNKKRNNRWTCFCFEILCFFCDHVFFVLSCDKQKRKNNDKYKAHQQKQKKRVKERLVCCFEYLEESQKEGLKWRQMCVLFFFGMKGKENVLWLCWTPVSFRVFFTLYFWNHKTKYQWFPWPKRTTSTMTTSTSNVCWSYCFRIPKKKKKQNNTHHSIQHLSNQTNKKTKQKEEYLFVCVCESWIAQEEEIFCVVCFMFQLKHVFFFLFFVRMKIQLESQRYCFVCMRVWWMCPWRNKFLRTKSHLLNQKKQVKVSKKEWESNCHETKNKTKLWQTFEVDFWFQKNPSSETKKRKWVLLVGLIVLRMWNCRSAQCVCTINDTPQRSFRSSRRCSFFKHRFGSTFQPTKFEMPEKCTNNTSTQISQAVQSSTINESFWQSSLQNSKITTPSLSSRIFMHTSTAFTTASSNAMKSKSLSTKLALCLTFFAQIWKTAFVWLESWFVSKKGKKNQFSVRCLRKWTWLFCLCVCLFFHVDLFMSFVDLFMSFVFLFCFSGFIFLPLKQTIHCCKMMKQQNQNSKSTKNLFWCELEKKNDQQVCFCSFFSLGLAVHFDMLLSLVFVATSVVTLWPATVIGLCWCECLAKWQYLVAEWLFLYSLEHNSFVLVCFGCWVQTMSPQLVPNQTWTNNTKKKWVWCVSFSSSFLSGNSQLSIQIINPPFLTFAFASSVSFSTRTGPTILETTVSSSSRSSSCQCWVDSFSPDFFSWHKRGKPCQQSRSLLSFAVILPMLSPSLFLSERITKKTKNTNKNNEQEKRTVFVSTAKPFWISWRTLNSLSDLLESLRGVHFVWCLCWCCWWVEKKTKKKGKRKGVQRIVFSGFVFLHSTKHNSKPMFDSSRNLILWLCLCCVVSLTHKQQEFVGTLQNVVGNMTTLNSTTLVSSKREGRGFASLITLRSLQPSVSRCVRDCECYFCLVVDSNKCLSEVFP